MVYTKPPNGQNLMNPGDSGPHHSSRNLDISVQNKPDSGLFSPLGNESQTFQKSDPNTSNHLDVGQTWGASKPGFIIKHFPAGMWVWRKEGPSFDFSLAMLEQETYPVFAPSSQYVPMKWVDQSPFCRSPRSIAKLSSNELLPKITL